MSSLHSAISNQLTRKNLVGHRTQVGAHHVWPLDQGVELTQGTTSYVWGGGRIVRGWSIELLLASLLAPFVAVAVSGGSRRFRTDPA